MFRTRYNCCCLNHPKQILCRQSLERSQNEVVNPVVQGNFGFFNNTSTAAYLQDEIIPLAEVIAQGSGISQTSAGAVLLSAGIYQITYFAQGTVSDNGEISVKLRLDGQEVVGTKLTQSGQSEEIKNLSQTVLISILESSILEIVNDSEQNTTFSLASLYAVRL